MKNMNVKFYGITDRSYLKDHNLIDAIEKAIKGGITVLQLREKGLNSRDFYYQALKVKEVTDHHGIPLIVNDRVDIALAVVADGVHVGQEDLPTKIARKIIGKEKILGVSVENVEQAIQAQKDGADYLGVGPVFPSPTKPEAKTISISEVKKIKESVNIPVVAIGGITAENLYDLMRETNVDGVAVISALFSGDVEENATRIRKVIEKVEIVKIVNERSQ
ncbi:MULTISPECIES: thiamine phosphate synthase [Petrotoga]|uniref:Thiamine-phosphate synthase n=2 Tax=Petrotoga sibirica TaxID=156202 RepID=A0A4R8F1S6_9BACT|nr:MULTISPECIES: thiamine phosphate synthase [Petrotoga]TDX16071.1 thiamine-phosphate pyrophosphorylase [Petrotoga sibirica]